MSTNNLDHQIMHRVIKGTPPTTLQAVMFSTMNVDLEVETAHRVDFVNLTEEVERAVVQSGVSDGMATVFVLHTTAALAITEWQSALIDDIKTWFEQTVRKEFPWEHNNPVRSDCDRNNADSHLRSLVLSPSVTLPIRGRKLLRGPWQSVVLIEFDGPRCRNLVIQVLGA